MKLELKHLAPYLPYGLIVQWIREDDKAIIMSDLNISDYNFLIKYKRAKPILRSLSDFTNEIEFNADKFVPIDRIKQSQHHLFFREDLKDSLSGLQYSEIQKLLEWHFDIFGLIENGLAVDINTLEL